MCPRVDTHSNPIKEKVLRTRSLYLSSDFIDVSYFFL